MNKSAHLDLPLRGKAQRRGWGVGGRGVGKEGVNVRPGDRKDRGEVDGQEVAIWEEERRGSHSWI